MSCDNNIPLMTLANRVADILSVSYVDHDDPRINNAVLTAPSIRGEFLLDKTAKQTFCGYVKSCDVAVPPGKAWLDIPEYPDKILTSREDSGEIKLEWEDIDDVLAGTSVGAIGQAIQEKLSDIVSIRSFGAKGDGVTDDTASIQAAIDATPVGGTLLFSSPGTYLVDTTMAVKKASDLNSNWTYGALLIDKPMRIIGNKKAILKIKDFSTAWANQDIGDSIGALVVNASGVHIDGLNIDGNGNNHYEMSMGFKYWEAGASLKRPPCGIIVTAETGQLNVEDVLIENCNITDTLAGVYFFGNALDGKRAQFLDGSLKTGVVKNCVSRNNTFSYLRGNGVIFNMGVDNCISDNDKFVNCMYHAVRIYSRAINCYAIGGRSTVNCDDIIARYNETDNGYWRTNNPASEWIKIIRSGFHIGGADSYSAALGYSVYNCGFDTCTLIYNRPKTVNYATYFEQSSLYIGAFTSTGLPNCYIKDCVSVGADYGVVLYGEAGLLTNTEGVWATGNKISKSNAADIYIRDVHNASVTHNHVTVNPNIEYAASYLQNFVNGLFANNTFTGSPLFGTYGVLVAGNATNLSLKDNDFSKEFILGRRYGIEAGSTPISMYPKRTVDLVNAGVIEGGALSSGWKVAYPSPGEGQENKIHVLSDGTFSLSLRLSAIESTGSTVATLATNLRPVTAVGFTAHDLDTGAAYYGRVLTDGRIQITIPPIPPVEPVEPVDPEDPEAPVEPVEPVEPVVAFERIMAEVSYSVFR